MRRLLIRPGAIGDCIVSFPALEFLRAEYTEVWVPAPVVPLVRFADRVCSIRSTGLDFLGIEGLEIPSSLAERLGSFDEVISWYGTNRPEFRLAMTRVCQRSIFLPALPHVGAAEHATDFYARQVGAPAGLVPKIRPEQVDLRPFVVIHPFSGSPRKNWPLPRFESLSNALSFGVEWIAGPEEELRQARHFEDLLDVAAWIRGARLYIGNDSGITHLAAATGAATVGLFGPTDPRIWAPRGERVTVLAHDPIVELAVPDVLAAANRLLGSP